MKQSGGFEIENRIAIVACKWHPLTAMENASKNGFRVTPGTTVIPVKCSGLVKVSFLLRLFARDIKGVLVLGCLEEDCRYFNGSVRCGRIVDETRKILELAGIDPSRLGFDLISESQGKEFKKIFTRFTRQFSKKRRRRVSASSRR